MKLPSLLLLMVMAGLTGCAAPATLAFRLNNQGNQAYRAGDYPTALSFYRQAQIAHPDYPELNVNAGSALHKEEDYDRAAKELRRALSSQDNMLRAQTHYALGNNLYNQGKKPDAVEEYKWALRFNPSDADAKHNLEFVLQQINEERAGLARLPKTDVPSQGQQSRPQPQPGDSNAGQNQGDSQNPPNGQPNGGGAQSGPTTRPQPPQQPDDTALNQALEQAGSEFGIEDAYKILDALRERERVIQSQWNRGGAKAPTADRDW